MRALGPGTALARSLALFAARPAATVSLALALLTSLCAVCCGLGVVAAPWFGCALWALQLGREHSSAGVWLRAGLVQLSIAGPSGALLVLGFVSAAPSTSTPGSTLGLEPPEFALWAPGLACVLAALALALMLTVHFEYAPALLIERGGRLVPALLESARAIAEAGLVRSWLTLFAARALQLAPFLAVLALAAARGARASTLLWAGLLLPLLASCLALGQGMIASSYLASRGAARAPISGPPARGAAAWLVVLGLALAGPAALALALLAPGEVAEGALPESAQILLELPAGPRSRELELPGGGLALAISEHSVRVAASDGGGAGALPFPRGRIRRVRIARALAPAGAAWSSASRDRADAERAPAEPPGAAAERGLDRRPQRKVPAFAIEAELARGSFTTWVDDAGVRLDDSLAARFAQALPPRARGLLVAALLWTALGLARSLGPLGQAQKRWLEAPSAPLAQTFARRARHTALWLAPAALCSQALAWAALLR